MGEEFVTLDGSTVRELVQIRDGARNLSLAEATVPPNGETIEHLHRTSEEVYRFISGRGTMRLGESEFEVAAGDAVLIPPATPQKLLNPHPDPLVLLCACAPPYSDEDTELLDSAGSSA